MKGANKLLNIPTNIVIVYNYIQNFKNSVKQLMEKENLEILYKKENSSFFNLYTSLTLENIK